MKGILARKVGMSRVICPESGAVTPVTLLEAPENTVLQVKTVEQDGYQAAVLGAFERKNHGKNDNQKFKYIKEVALGAEAKAGDKHSLAALEGVDFVSVMGTTKGRGFAGVIKRHKFSRGPETHGSHHHREPGSVGTCAKPARIIKGKKLPGHHGDVQKTLRKVKVVQIDSSKNLIALKGAVPGAINSFVLIATK